MMSQMINESVPNLVTPGAGSATQYTFLSIRDDVRNNLRHRFTNSTATSHSFHMYSPAILTASLLFHYRIRRPVNSGPLVETTAEWDVHLNDIFNYEDVRNGGWNKTHDFSPTVDIRKILVTFSGKFVRNKTF